MQIKLLKIEVEVENVVLMNHSLNFLMHLILKKKRPLLCKNYSNEAKVVKLCQSYLFPILKELLL